MPRRYKINQFSAKALASYAEEKESGVYEYKLSAAATERCKTYTAKHEQSDNALFYQIMSVIKGEDFKIDDEINLVTDLSDVIFYIDFKDIFDRDSDGEIYKRRQAKCKSMFRREGIELDFGKGPVRYVTFEHSNSMGRLSRHAFIRQDICDEVRKRIMLDMKVGMCQLSKLYSYVGLMFSDGTRIDGIEIDKPHRVIVVDNPIHTEYNVPVITVEADKQTGSMMKYKRLETVADVKVECFDGEGLISKQYAKVIDKAFCGKHIHHSFQIRMPFVKGMLHKVNFKDFLGSGGEEVITDIWGVDHNLNDVDIILTKSMFKGYNWLCENNMSFLDFKRLLEDKENRKGIMNDQYSPKLQAAIEKCRDASTSIETLPALADDLKKNTPKIKAKKVKDNLLFSFAVSPDWKNELDKNILKQVQDLIKEYKACLNRIRIANRQSVKQMRRMSDVNRVLFLRGQDDAYFYEELYALFADFTPGEIADIRNAIVEERWQLMDIQERMYFLERWLDDEKFKPYFKLFSDFRYNGYRVLGDLICDIDDDNSLYDKKKLYRDEDSERFIAMMEAYENKLSSDSYREAVAKKCREFLDDIIKPKFAVRYVVALNARDFMWDVLFDKVEENVLRRGKDA